MRSLHKEEEMIILGWIRKNVHPQPEMSSEREKDGGRKAFH